MQLDLSPSLIERFLTSIDITQGCWRWTGRKRGGYGSIRIHWPEPKREFYAHRLSYVLFCGDIPPGHELDHLCRNTYCVRPEHLEPVTHWENTRRGTNFIAELSRRTHCKRGHPLEGDNLRLQEWRHKTMRQCLECRRLRDSSAAKQLPAAYLEHISTAMAEGLPTTQARALIRELAAELRSMGGIHG